MVVIFASPETTILAIFAVVELVVNVFNSALLTTRASDSLLNIPSIFALFISVVFWAWINDLFATIVPVILTSEALFAVNWLPTLTSWIARDVLFSVFNIKLLEISEEIIFKSEPLPLI